MGESVFVILAAGEQDVLGGAEVIVAKDTETAAKACVEVLDRIAPLDEQPDEEHEKRIRSIRDRLSKGDWGAAGDLFEFLQYHLYVYETPIRE